MRFAVCPTRNCNRLHVPCDFACDLLCDLVHARFLRNCKTDTESHTKSHLQFGAKKDWKYFLSETPNRRYTISHLRYAANRTWNRARNRSCNRPLSPVCPYSGLTDNWLALIPVAFVLVAFSPVGLYSGWPLVRFTSFTALAFIPLALSPHPSCPEPSLVEEKII
jgi:hypothetical protein